MKEYDHIGKFNNGFAKVKMNNKYGFIDINYEEICEIKYDYVYDFIFGIAIVFLNGKNGIINNKGKEICDIKYDDINCFDYGYTLLSLNNKFSYINEKGKEITPFVNTWFYADELLQKYKLNQKRIQKLKTIV